MPARPTTESRKGRAAKRTVEDDIGPRLRRHREERQLSLRELARRLGISPSAISQFETGKSRLSVSTLYAIVTELGISLDELFSGIDGEAALPGSPRKPPLAPPTPARRSCRRGTAATSSGPAAGGRSTSRRASAGSA